MIPSRQRLMVVDDDPKLRDLLNRYLSAAQFNVNLAADASALYRLLQKDTYDLIVLDLMLPGEDGLAILRRIRSQPRTPPVIMLTAKGDEIDRIIGLEMGADDYLSKPFNPRELLARIHAVLRRSPPPDLPGTPAHDLGTMNFGPFEFDGVLRTLRRAGQTIALTSGEFAVLKALARQPRVPVSREKLMQWARGREYGAHDRSLDVQISRLRKMLEADPSQPRYIQTVWGVGYVFIPD